MKKLLKYIRPHWVAAILAPLFMILEVSMDLLQPLFMATIIDDGIMAGSQSHILQTGLYMIGAAIIGLIGGVGCTIFASYASMRFGQDLREDVFHHVQKFSFRNIDQLETGSLITRLTNDIVQLQNVVQMLLRVLVRSPLLMIGSIVMTIFISPKLAIIVAISVPILFIVMFFIIRGTLPLFTKVQSRLDRLNTVLQENLSGMRISKAFVRRQYEKDRFGQANDDLTTQSVKAQRLVSINGPILSMILNVSVIAVLLLGGKDVINDSFEVGSLVAFINYVTQVLFAVSSVAMHLVRVSSAKVSADRVLEVLNTESDLIEHTKLDRKIFGQVEYHNVSFRYRADQVSDTLRNINFKVEAGHKIAIIGATGSGKSTLLQLIPRLYDVSEGQILIDGIDLKQYSFAALRSQTAMVLQETILFSGSIRENICYGRPDASKQEIIAAAIAAQADEFIVAMKDGYDTVIGQRGINLSGGQKQRISIARALLMKPAILLLDDSTSAIDTRTEGYIQVALRKLMQGRTTFIVAQKISSVIDADQIFVMEHGEIIAQGNHEQLIVHSPQYREIYQSQLGQEEVSYE
ncbi:MAG: ABC transporter ATP-binding protein/permease [Candidatus Pristimantibacillus lignocellulolyticus]|uniref:ABC transporter ATP-binding protein/permease n=1 Tax=Candidatus Pristimantibacillus lignocellulolyticus TaxID=2994561 RepID=A0A9J6ZE73_9BACL|nr:MAG: ABC transporter ATP-binding protein/permease [Candidatus Pristimantibacillus lignocellulolyticus]